MTIRRQYSLPNCTLVLDGLSDGNSTTGTPDPRPLMSSLFNAECHFVGADQHLFGGRDFLTNLVAAVSNYAQEFLSGISHPVASPPVQSLVSIVKGDRDNLHHLKATLESDDRSAGNNHQPTQVNLSTIQLFDLLEAIDQFLADKRTLPDIMVPLQPVSKAVAKPIATQAAPVGLGLASLVAASLIGYALPSPKVSPPKSSTPTPAVQPKTESTAPAASPTPAAPTSSSPQPAASATPDPALKLDNSIGSSSQPTANNAPIVKTGQILEATQIGFLERKLQRDLNQNWQARGRVKQPASFVVNVNQDGQIVNYQVLGRTNAAASNLTPLPKLTNKKTDPNQAIGNFNVVFAPNGIINVSPAQTLQGKMSLGQPINDPKLQTELATQLQTTLQKSLPNSKPLHSRNLNYRVAVTKTGEIADYEPTDLRAFNHEAKTPLPKLTKFNAQAAISQEPLAQYSVIFQADGKISVRPK